MVLGSRIVVISMLAVMAVALALLFLAKSTPENISVKVNPKDDVVAVEAKQVQAPSDEITLNNTAFELINKDGKCQLQSGKNTLIKLAIKAPCYFVRQNDKLLEYKQKDQNIIAVIGDTIEKSKRCGRVARGILMTKSGVSLSSRIAKGSIYCADKGLDNAQYDLFGKAK